MRQIDTPSVVTQEFIPVSGELPGRPAIGTGHTEHTGELRLVLTVLADAIETALQEREIRDRADRREAEMAREEAIEWIFSNDRSWPFSFLTVCETLGIEPLGMREAVARGLRQRTSTPVNVRRLARTVSRGIRRRRRDTDAR